jgi:hypothetical protein
VETAALAKYIENPELLEKIRVQLERRLMSRLDDAALAAYPHVWELRRRTGYATLSQSLRVELIRIRATDRMESPLWLETLKAGYALLQDTESIRAVEDRILATRPSSQVAYTIMRERRGTSGPLDGSLARWPHLPQVYIDRWDLARMSKGSDLVEAAAAFLEVMDRYPDLFLEIPASLQVAEAFMAENLETGRIPELLAEAKRQVDDEESYRQTSEIPEVRVRAMRRMKDVNDRCARVSASLQARQ